MGRFLSGLFGAKQTSPPATALRVSTALQGVAIPLLLAGQARMPINLINYFGFSSQGGSGGKGGIAGGGKGQSGTTYSTSFIGAVCEGPILAFTANWINANKNEFANYGIETEFLGSYTQQPWSGVATFDPTQSLAYRGLAYIASLNFNLQSSPSLPQINVEALAVNSGNVVPGQPDGDPSLALIDFLTNPFYGLGFPKARMAPLGGTASSWQSYCKALGFGVSQTISGSVQASSAMTDLVESTNSEACWQNGLLTVVPRGDTPVQQGTITSITETYIIPPLALATPTTPAATLATITIGNVGLFVQDMGVNYFAAAALTLVPYPPTQVGQYSQINGTYYFTSFDVGAQINIAYTYAAAASYIPDTTTLYDFTINDFLTNQGTIGTGLASANSPVSIVRKGRDQMLNNVKVEYLDRNNAYNPVDIEVKDMASIIQFRRVRPGDIKQYHHFALASAAVQSASLKLIKEQIARTFQWTCGKHFTMILQLMKIVTLTFPAMGLSRMAVRIIEIQENQDQTLTITAEEFNGTATAPIYGSEAAVGHQPNYNAQPGDVNVPIVFEPTDELGRALVSSGGLMLAIGLSGSNPVWGGANVFISYDGQQYTEVGTILGEARTGVLSAPLPTVLANQTGGQTIDTTNTLSVDLTESTGQLISVSQIDANSLNTRCFIGPKLGQPNAGSGEVIAYQNAALTAQSKYNLTYLVRGAYGTEAEIATWPAGTGFVRLDGQVLAIPFDKSRIGSTVFFKFTSFNIYAGAGVVQSLADVGAYPYTIQGLALGSPLPVLQNVRTVFTNGRLGVAWDEITDFRGAIRVEVRQGNAFNSAINLGTVAHPPYYLPGNGTYWFTAWCQPAAGLIVRSEFPVSIAVSGATISGNSVASYDAKANGWPGTFVNTSIDHSINAVRVNGGQMITSGPTPAGSSVLNFASVPAGVVPGLTVSDLTDSGVIQAGTVVLSATSTTVTLSKPIPTDWGGPDFSPADFGSRGVLTGDVIQFGTTQLLTLSGTYQLPLRIDVGHPAPVTMTVSLQATGVPVGQNILAEGNILADPNILGSTVAQFVEGFCTILISQDGVTFAPPVKYAPGDYFGRVFEFVFNLSTVDPNTIPYLLAAVVQAQVPARYDHVLTNAVLSAAGLAVQFTPDGTATPAPFNGGPNGATVPHILATWGDEVAGDTFSITNLTAAGATFQIKNNGIGVLRSQVNIIAEGF